MTTRKSPKQSALLLILVCVFAACTEYNDNPLVETDIPNNWLRKVSQQSRAHPPSASLRGTSASSAMAAGTTPNYIISPRC